MKKCFIFSFYFLLIYGNYVEHSNAQIKLNEGFEDAQFPPEGWTERSILPAGGNWISSKRMSESGKGCAVSNFSQTISNNFLITKSFIPTAGDSLSFSLRQTFWNVYKDTFNVYISTTDSLPSSMNILIAHFHDGFNYPAPLGYGNYRISLNSFAGQKVWIGFQHINVNGDNVRLDNIRVGSPLFNEIGVVGNLSPVNDLPACSPVNIIPSAKIKNFGELNQSTPFSITYSISGPVTYSSTKYDTLSAGHLRTIYFDSVTVSDPGIYTIKIFVNLPGDQNISNDTLNTSFKVYETNFGGGLSNNGGYYFSNSSECAGNAPAQPQFCWKDTSGSKNLILNSTDLSDGLLEGDIDNGYFRLGNILPAGYKIKFFGNDYDSLFISTNGIIGLSMSDLLLSNHPLHFEESTYSSVPLISPLWIDLDFGNDYGPENRLSYKLAANQLIVTYDKAHLTEGDSSDFVSFQVCFELGNSLPDNSKILIQYKKESSGINFISKYLSNSINQHSVGLINNDGNSFVSYRFTDTSGVVDFGQILNHSTALEFGPDPYQLNNKCSQLTLKALFEFTVDNNDSVRIFLRDFNSPYNILEERAVYLNDEGIADCGFTIPDENSRFFLAVKQRNSLETWSRETGETFNSYNLNYDFSHDSTMAYGNNLKVRNGIAYIYKGDLNDDGVIDVADLSIIDNNVANYNSGDLLSDLNGDRTVDVRDLAIIDDNNYFFVALVAP